MRLPFVIAGLGSIWLIYLIGKKIFNEQAGLISALFLAISSYHVWISRIGLQESIVILLVLLTFYLFIKALDSGCYWQWGISLGLAFLAKYTTFIILPIFFSYLLIYKRSVFKDKNFWLGIILFFIIFSPVIIYNLSLYQARGHFDLQFSYLFNQQVDEWRFLPGKIQAGSLPDRFINLIPAVYQGLLPPMFFLVVISIFYSIYYFSKTKNKFIFLLLLSIVFYLCLFLLVGPMKRFVVVLVPFLLLLSAWFINRQKNIIKYLLIIILVIIEIFFSYNTLLANYPVGWEGITYSYVKKESYNWGYAELDKYLDQFLDNKKPALTFTTNYNFLEDIKNKALITAEKNNYEDKGILLIYDANMFDLATLWLFHRRMVYQGWPIVTAETYLSQNNEFWISQGITDFYFIKIIDSEMLQQQKSEQTGTADILADRLNTITPEIIKRPDGREVFAIYRW